MFKILRPTLWFCKNDEVLESQFKIYFSEKGIRELIKYGFIEPIHNETIAHQLEFEKRKFEIINTFCDKVMNAKTITERKKVIDNELGSAIAKINQLKDLL
ncbi:MAG: hypothetical protein RIR01_2320 [Bacteroidota bacterium]|jgi:hypothetical protein